MYSLSCRDLGLDDDFVVTGETVDEIRDKMMTYLEVKHSDFIDTKWTPAQQDELIREIAERVRVFDVSVRS